jgi:hypothetical protein
MHLSGNTDEFLLELILGCGINLRVKHSEAGGTWIITISAKRHWNSYHLALDLGGIRRPVNKYNFVARIAIRSGVPERTGGEAGASQRTNKRKTKENRGVNYSKSYTQYRQSFSGNRVRNWA